MAGGHTDVLTGCGVKANKDVIKLMKSECVWPRAMEIILKSDVIIAIYYIMVRFFHTYSFTDY